MSQKEMDQMDQECESIVNSSAAPEAMAAAEAIAEEWHEENREKICADFSEGEKCGESAGVCAKRRAELQDSFRKEKSRRRLGVVLRVLVSILLGAFFVAVLIKPSLILWLVNAGVLCCGIVAAISIDRYCRGCHYDRQV